MGQLPVRSLPDDIVEALKAQARAHGRSTEEEHREILKKALRPSSFCIKEHLWAVPTEDENEDLFPRQRDLQREVEF